MTRALVHRGPDGEGYYSARGVTLGHRRLSVIDLETGSQPMTTADGRWQIAADGIEYYRIEGVTVSRYAYRGNKIPTPWPTANPA